jgi:hypothetical protein
MSRFMVMPSGVSRAIIFGDAWRRSLVIGRG